MTQTPVMYLPDGTEYVNFVQLDLQLDPDPHQTKPLDQESGLVKMAGFAIAAFNTIKYYRI
jgi:hypothetical protein